MVKYLRSQLLNMALIISAVGFFTGCGSSGGGGGGGGSSLPPVLASIEVKPNSEIFAVGDSGRQFSAEPKDVTGNTINGEEIFWEIVNNDGQKGSVSATGWYRPPTVLPDSSNVVMVKAFSRNNPEKNGFASVTLLTGAGLSFGGNARVASHTTGYDDYAFSGQNVAVFNQTVYTVWADNPDSPSGNYDISFARSLDRGRSIYCQSRLQLAQDQFSPSLALDRQGNIYVTAYDNSIGSNYGILFLKGQPSTNITNCVDISQQGVVFSSDTETYFSPHITVNSDGNVYITWAWSSGGTSGIYFARGIPDSQTGRVNFGQKVLVAQDSTGASVYEDLQATVALSDKIYITFSQTLPGSSHIVLAKSVDGGSSFQELRVSDTLAFALYPAMAVDSAGMLYVAWTDFRNANPKIYLAKSTNEGQNFSIFNITANIEGEQWLPTLAVDQVGGLYLAWENVDIAADQDIFFAKSVDGGLNFSTPVQINDDPTNQYRPNLALDSAGRAFVFWFDERNTCPSSCPYALYLAVGQ